MSSKHDVTSGADGFEERQALSTEVRARTLEEVSRLLGDTQDRIVHERKQLKRFAVRAVTGVLSVAIVAAGALTYLALQEWRAARPDPATEKRVEARLESVNSEIVNLRAGLAHLDDAVRRSEAASAKLDEVPGQLAEQHKAI